MVWLLVLPALLLFISISNFFTIREPRTDSKIEDSVSVIVAMRNEAENVAALVQSLLAQSSLTDVEFIFLDDNSEDNTLELLRLAASGQPHVRVIQGAPLPSGWIGKTWALHQLFKASRGEIIVSIDADVRITPDAISKSITLMRSKTLDFISPYPRQIATTLGERLIQPLLQWSWMTTLLLRVAERASFSSMAVANGQFFLVRRAALTASGGYESVKAAILDDVFLARALLKSGSHGVVVNGAAIAECRMYTSWAQIESGYGKSLRYAFGSHFGSIIAVIFIFLTGIAPLVLALTGSLWGWLGFALITCTRILSAIRARTRIIDSLFHWISSTLLIYLIIYSYLKRGEITWKGRAI
ncbi:MAG: glycosyltransferase [Candidatus Planktophila sp.]|nr:glycosyltransferase [Candidatus Planktophila sp.]